MLLKETHAIPAAVEAWPGSCSLIALKAETTNIKIRQKKAQETTHDVYGITFRPLSSSNE